MIQLRIHGGFFISGSAGCLLYLCPRRGTLCLNLPGVQALDRVFRPCSFICFIVPHLVRFRQRRTEPGMSKFCFLTVRSVQNIVNDLAIDLYIFEETSADGIVIDPEQTVLISGRGIVRVREEKILGFPDDHAQFAFTQMLTFRARVIVAEGAVIAHKRVFDEWAIFIVSGLADRLCEFHFHVVKTGRYLVGFCTHNAPHLFLYFPAFCCKSRRTHYT